jgi:hypothetical protein
MDAASAVRKLGLDRMSLDVIRHRLNNQRIVGSEPALPAQVVSWLGAMQAQDRDAVKWAVGLRCRDAAEATVERALADGTVVRTWLMRGTLQVVTASDVRWMLALLAPRQIANSARRYRQLDLDEDTFARSGETLITALRGGGRLTRAQIARHLEDGGISAAGQRSYHILRRAALEGLICLGPMKDKKETYVLLEEWVPVGGSPASASGRGALASGTESGAAARERALAELARRYFFSRGPATLRDYVWWSGLKVAEARAGLEKVADQLDQETVDGQMVYYVARNEATSQGPSPAAHLLPAYDEYLLGYRARDIVLDASYDRRAVSSNGVFRPVIVLDGQIVGTWARTVNKRSVTIAPHLFRPLTGSETQVLLAAADRYGAYLGLPVRLA